ncbi:MAG: ABC transporter permease [Sphingobacterium sp.]
MMKFIRIHHIFSKKAKNQTLAVIISLALSLACYIFSTAFFWSELTYDRSYENFNRIVRFVTDIVNEGEVTQTAFTGFPLSETLERDLPGIETTTKLLRHESVRVKVNNELSKNEAFYSADNNVFRVFALKFVEGSQSNALDAPNTVVLTESAAYRYMGKVQCIGQVIEVDGVDYEIKGVVEDQPQNTDLRFSALMSFDNNLNSNDWMEMQYYTFALFKEEFVPNQGQLENIVANISEKYYNRVFRDEGSTMKFNIIAQKLSSLHFSDERFGDTPKGNFTYFVVISAMGMLVLILASINYITISVTNAIMRIKQVGIRKVFGATDFQITKGFVVESAIVMVFSTILSLLLVFLFVPYFNSVTGKDFTFLSLFTFRVCVSVLIGLLIVVVLSGVYPMFVVKKYNVNKIFGNYGKVKASMLLNVLVVFQFVLSISFASLTFYIYQQTSLLLNKNLAFEADDVMVVEVPYDDNHLAQIQLLKNRLLQNDAVVNVSIGSYSVPGAGFASESVKISSNKQSFEGICNLYRVDENFVDVLAIEKLAGRNFRQGQSDYQRKCLINVELAKKMGFGNDVAASIGASIESNDKKYEIVGVMPDFIYGSMNRKVDPLVMLYDIENPYEVLVKFNTTANLNLVKQEWNKLMPEYPFIYKFLNDIIAEQYKKEVVIRDMLLGLSLIAIIISYFGLYAVVSVVTRSKVRQIAIRKVLGANNFHLFNTFLKSFVWNYFVAFVISSCFSIIVINRWLQDFEYRIYPTYFAVLIIGCVGLVTLVAVSIRLLKQVSRSKPSKVLRNL